MANGYVRYSNSIHLDGFQILDFCIENAISLESLSDRNLGRKVFLTGNDTNEGYLRENVWDGTRWRAAAYLDDLTSFKDEDFNKLKEKVDTLIGDGVDMDGIIESWKEVEAFLAGMSDTKTLMTMLDGKLDKKGGTITGDITVKGLSSFNKRLSMREGAILDFYKADGNLIGVLGPYSGNNYELSWYDGSAWNILIHSGNVGDYALKYTRTGSPDLSTMPLVNTFGLWQGVGPYIRFGISDSYNIVLRARQGVLQAQVNNASVEDSDWKTIAFTDSDITGNAATATRAKYIETMAYTGNDWYGDKYQLYAKWLNSTICDWRVTDDANNQYQVRVDIAKKLYTPRSLWGNEFDGTQSLDNAHIQLNNARAIYWKAADKTTNIEALSLNNENTFLIGQGVAKAAGSTVIYGNNIKFCYGTAGSSAQTAMTINSEGRVLIGGDIDGTSKLSVSGNSVFSGEIYSRNKVFFGTEGLYLSSTGVSWHKDYAYESSLIGFENDKIKLYQRVLIGGAEDDGVTALQVKGAIKATNASITNNVFAKSFRTEGERGLWKGNEFSSSLTSEDLAISGNVIRMVGSIRVDNMATFNGGALIPTGQKLTIGSVTFEEDAAGRVKVDGDMYTTGTLASGGKAKEGTGTGSGSANVRDFELPADGKTTYDCDHLLKSKNVIVQVFEKTLQNNIEVWEMIVADVTIVTEDRVTVTFGRPTTKVHKVHIIGGNVS